jgi:SAM-dependent methyltransferase
VRLRDLAFFVDHVGDAAGVFVFFGVAGAVCDSDGAVGVAEQREGELVLFGKTLIFVLRVEADAEDLRVFRFVLGLEVPEPGTFARSTGCVGFRIEPEHDFLAAQVAQSHGVAVVIGRFEIGRIFTRLEHGRFSSGHRSNHASQSHGAYSTRRMRLDEWNARYRSREAIDDEPARLLVDAARDLAPGRALDLACGAGRNALWLAGQGWDVVAIDGAEEAIRIVQEHDAWLHQRRRDAAGPAGGTPAFRIDARVLDLENGAALPFDDASFDLVAILYFLHRPLFAEAQRIVRPGGIVVTAVRTRGHFSASLDELRAAFDGWELLHESDGEIAELVARRR